MQTYIRTDLATEWLAGGEKDPDGVTTCTKECDDYSLFCAHIQTPDAARALGRPCGHYCVLQVGAFHQHLRARQSAIADALTAQLREMADRLAPQAKRILVVCLGNRAVTPDALGPLCFQELTVTRHLKDLAPHIFQAADGREICAIAPGVIGQTGIETRDQIRACVDLVKPDLILAIDALAAKGVDRLTTSVQLSDVGISPGSGVGNRRAALDKDSLGVDVLSIGVPTVVDSSTLVYDVLEQGGMGDLTPELRAILENGKNFFVTSKDCDIAVIALSSLIAHAINTVFAPALSESAF